MATPIAGTKGHVLVGGTEVLEVKQWDLDVEAGLYNADTLGVEWSRNVSGLRKWSGKLTGFYSVADDVGQQALHNAVFNALSITLTLQNETNSYDGTAFPTKVSIGNPVDGIVTCDFEFTGSDPLNFT